MNGIRTVSYTHLDVYKRQRYYKGKFYVYFGTPDEGYFMSTATDPAGPWEPLHCVKAEKGWDDCCPFFDDDGQLYFVGTHFADKYKTYLYRMTPDGKLSLLHI